MFNHSSACLCVYHSRHCVKQTRNGSVFPQLVREYPDQLIAPTNKTVISNRTIFLWTIILPVMFLFTTSANI